MNSAIDPHGIAAAKAFFNQRNYQPLRQIIRDASATDKSRSAVGMQAFMAAIGTFAAIIDGSRAAGYRFTPDPPSGNKLAYRTAISQENLGKDSGVILSAIFSLMSVAPGLRTLEDGPAPATQTSQPIEVRVVAMPARKRVSDVSHNMAGEITGAMQIESDV